MESKRIAWSHLFLLAALAILHRRSHAQPPGTSSTWVSDVLKVSLKKARFSVVLTGFFSCIVFLIFLSLLIRHCVRSCARSNRRATRAAAQRRLRQVMEQCPVLEYSEVKALRIGNCALDCAVCLTEFGDTENVRLLPQCNHVFHPDCIDQWFASRLTCPVCRAKLCPSDDDNAAADAATESNQEESPAADGEIERQSAEESPEETIDEIGSAGLPTETELPIWSTTAPARFARSHSTGISLERYALRLPEHVREEIFRNQRELRRCASSNDVALPVEWSSKRGIDDHQTKKRAFLSLTPPFVSKNLSSEKFLKLSTDGSSSRRRLPV